MTTPINALPSPTDASPNDPPIHFTALNNQLDTRLVARFDTIAARDAAITSPVDGMECYVAAIGRTFVRRGGVWTKIGGPRELLYENGNAGSSGVINVGAGQTGVLSVNVPAAGVAADTAHVHVVLGVKSSGTSVGSAILTVNGVSTAPQVFNLDTTTTIPVVLEMPVSIPAGTFLLGISLAATSGSSLSLNYSAIRVTF